jgi:succinate dehydrogenase/fumarate reductase flavoprotein subunit
VIKLGNLGKVIDTDVLILGSGAAGCGAAIGAKEQGARVLIVDKGKIESSGALGGGNDHFSAVLNTGPEWDTAEALIDAYRGFGSADKIRKAWVEPMPIILERLEEMGVEFMKNPDGSYYRTVGFGQSGPLWINIRNGQFVKRRIARWIREHGVGVLDHVMVTKLLTDNGKVAGAAGFNILDGTFYILRGKSVVMALGNTVARVTTNSTGVPFNCMAYPYDTGSQCVMAYDAGAKIHNLDAVQRGGTIIPKGFGAPGMNAWNSMGAHLLNALGERFMGKYDPKWENGSRALEVLGTYTEMIEGKGPPFYLDVRHFSESDLALLKTLLVGDRETYLDYVTQNEIDIAKEPIEVEISESTLGGKILENDKYESNLRGLFNGCIYGLFSGAMCSGYAAGIEAGKAAMGTVALTKIDDTQVYGEKERIFAPMNKQNGITAKAFERLIQQVMGYYMGFKKNVKGVEVTLQKLDKIEPHVNDIKATNYHELMRAHEAKHMLRHCQLGTKATLERMKSAHQGHPSLDKYLFMWHEDGVPKMAWKPRQ